MSQVHPEFDPDTRTWFTPCGLEAPSLAALSRMMPGVEIVGYRPFGYAAPLVLREPRPRGRRRVASLAPTSGHPAVPPVPRPPRRRPTMNGPRIVWTDELNAQLRGMVRDGCSAADIAREFGTTRNAIIGKCSRLELQLRGGKIGRPRGSR